MGELSSTSRKNILQNKYFLDDDHEDPGFHLDWTIIQMLIPSAIMHIELVKNKTEKIREEQDDKMKRINYC